jgi:hypothetical protein
LARICAALIDGIDTSLVDLIDIIASYIDDEPINDILTPSVRNPSTKYVFECHSVSFFASIVFGRMDGWRQQCSLRESIITDCECAFLHPLEHIELHATLNQID